MLIKLSGGTIYDPAHQVDGKVMDIYVRKGRIVARGHDGERIDQVYDLRGKVVMAGDDEGLHLVNDLRVGHGDSGFLVAGVDEQGEEITTIAVYDKQ